MDSQLPRGLDTSLDQLIKERFQREGRRGAGSDQRGRGRQGGEGRASGRGGHQPGHGWQGHSQNWRGPVVILRAGGRPLLLKNWPLGFADSQWDPKSSNGIGSAQQGTPSGLLFPGGFLPAMLPPLELQYPGAMERTEPPAIPQASQDEATGEVLVKFKATTIIKAAPDGALTLDSGGFKGPSTYRALDAALGAVGMKISAQSNNQWMVSDGRTLTRFEDGMVLPAKGKQAALRGQQLLQAFSNADALAAAAATRASDALAAAMGILPSPNAGAPTPMGGMHNGGFGPPNGRGRGRSRGRRGRGAAQPQRPQQVENGIPQSPDKIRRLRAQGRYMPY